MEEAAAGAAVGFGHFDAHHAELEQLPDERGRHLCLFVHLTDQRTHPGVGELAHTVAEQALILGEYGERRGDLDGLLPHGEPPDSE